MPKLPDQIKVYVARDGRRTYWFRIRVAGRLEQFTFSSAEDALTEYRRLTHQRSTGEYVGRTTITFAEACDGFLAAKATRVRTKTLQDYRDALKPARERFGDVRLGQLSRRHVDELASFMLTSGRRSSGEKGTPLSPASVNRTIDKIEQVLRYAQAEGMVAKNVAESVERIPQRATTRATWTEQEQRAFLKAAADDRLHAAWLLTSYGLRRSEVCGLRWTDVDLDAGTVTIAQSRVDLGRISDINDTKSRTSARTLPLDADLVAALKAYALRLKAERLAAGPAYEGSDLVVVDELGRPIRPEHYSDLFRALTVSAGVKSIRLHEVRHTCGTLMHLNRVPTAMVSMWLGHSSVAFTARTYVHGQAELLGDASKVLAALRNGESDHDHLHISAQRVAEPGVT